MAVGLQALAALVLVHLEAAFLLQVAHGGKELRVVRVAGGSGLFDLGELGDVALDVADGVFVNDALFGGLIHGGDIRDAGSLCRFGVTLFGRLSEGLAKGLQAGDGGRVARGIPDGLASGFDGGFSVGHDVFGRFKRGRNSA